MPTIINPFVYITDHVVQAKGIGLETADRRRIGIAIIAIVCLFVKARRLVLRGLIANIRIFPFRYRGQLVALAGFFDSQSR